MRWVGTKQRRRFQKDGCKDDYKASYGKNERNKWVNGIYTVWNNQWKLIFKRFEKWGKGIQSVAFEVVKWTS